MHASTYTPIHAQQQKEKRFESFSEKSPTHKPKYTPLYVQSEKDVCGAQSHTESRDQRNYMRTKFGEILSYTDVNRSTCMSWAAKAIAPMNKIFAKPKLIGI